MSDINNIVATGRLGSDAELVETKNGNFVRFSLAVGKKVKNQDYVSWLPCTMADSTYSKAVLPYLTKGSQIGISNAEININVVEKDGGKVSYTNIHVNSITLLGKGNGGSSSTAQSGEITKVVKASDFKEVTNASVEPADSLEAEVVAEDEAIPF